MTSSIAAVDLFAGAGGASTGLKEAGIHVLSAIENDADAADSYRRNHTDVQLVESDIRRVDAGQLRRSLRLRRGALALLKACPPCQGFSTLAAGKADEARNDLVLDIARFIEELKPKSILLENVPGLSRDRRLDTLIAESTKLGYKFQKYIVDASSLGVPQRRKRLIAIGVSSRIKQKLPNKFEDLLQVDFPIQGVTVKEAFSELKSSALDADPLDRCRKSGPRVLERIRAVPINGNRFDLPQEHRLACHSRIEGRRATSSYGRLRFDDVAPTMTTRCTTPACGSFIHPTEHRGITLREAATLQTFPLNYLFSGGYDSIERQIGNAVPVKMATVLGTTIKKII